MKLREKYKISKAILKRVIFHAKTPLVVFLTITTRCNARCVYCNCWQLPFKELSTEQIFKIVDELAYHGTLRISITGGEPLLRDDIGDIIGYIKKKKIFVSINSNGLLLPENIKKIKEVDLVQLGFDGPKEIHDILRPVGTYQRVIDSMVCCTKNKIRFSLNTTIVNQSFKDIDFILDKAEEFGCYVNFQPVVNMPYASSNIKDMLLSRTYVKKIFNYILYLKKKNKRIFNSIRGLRYYLSYWPEGKNIRCWAGILFCVIGCNGLVYSCSMMENISPFENCLENGFSEAFSRLKRRSCKNCWCSSTLELNYILSLNFDSIYNAIKMNL